MSRPHTPTVLATMTQRVLTAADSLGIDTSHLRRHAGLAADSWADPDARIDAELHWQVWEAVVQDSRTEGLGLILGSRFRPEDFGVVGHGMIRCATVRDGLAHLERYGCLLGENAPHIHDSNDSICLRTVLRPRVARIVEVGDCIAADLFRAICVMTGRTPAVREVRLQRPQPREISGYRMVFGGVPISFHGTETAVLVDRAVLDLPLVQADHALSRYLARQADVALARLPRSDSLADEVRRVLPDQLHTGEPTAANIARTLGCSTRTLQRRLLAEGTSLSELLEEARRELAELYLRERDVSIGEIAYLLGYSEPSAFHRAFRRWTGITPQAFRTETDAKGGGRHTQARYPQVA